MRTLHLTLLAVVLQLLLGGDARAQALPPPGFVMAGYIQDATLDGTVAGHAAARLPNTSPLAGGTLTVNGIKMLIPNNTLVQLPANTLSWAQLFDPASSQAIAVAGIPLRTNHAAGITGLTLMDNPAGTLPDPWPAFEVLVNGNIVPDPKNPTGAPLYIIGGLVLPIAQDLASCAMGRISFIDYAHGRMRVGGIPNDPNCQKGSPLCTGALIEINDRVGRFGLHHSPDPRFSADTDNPTITAASGYPMCVPRVVPPAIDAQCPLTNRPLNPAAGPGRDPFLPTGAPLKTFTMPAPAAVVKGGPDPTRQVPLMVGDDISYNGTTYKLDPADPNFNPSLPRVAPANTYLSVHTIVANLGYFTAPGTQPTYVAVRQLVVPTTNVKNQITPPLVGGNPPTPIAVLNDTRVLLQGFTTDPSTLVDVMTVAIDPVTGTETEHLFATLQPDAGAGAGVLRGRFRLETPRATGTFPATRNYRARSHNGTTTAANGLVAGQYSLPNFTFLFAEPAVFGNPLPPNSYNLMPFLARGEGPFGGPGAGPPIIGRLDPWPGP